MSSRLCGQLLEQSEHLLRREPRRPKAASLRRAVSSAYYAMFHLLVDEASRNLLGVGTPRRRLRHLVARAFSHRSMKNASKAFLGGTLPTQITNIVGVVAIPQEMRQIAQIFVELQEERHRADYDLENPFLRHEAMRLIALADDAFGLWENIKSHDAAQLYLLSLLIWEQVKAG